MEASTPGASGARRTAVVVDDAPEMRGLVRVLLEREGVEVVEEAGDGRSAIDAATRHRPHLVLLDVSMPVMDGLEALPHIIEASPDSRVVVYTAHGQDVHDRARTAGAHDVLSKDLSVADLRRHILAALGDLPP